MLKLIRTYWGSCGNRLANHILFISIMAGGLAYASKPTTPLITVLDTVHRSSILIKNDGFYSIHKSSVRADVADTNKLPFRVWVQHDDDTRLIVHTVLAGGETFTFDNFLGYLETGDQVHAQLGEEEGMSSQSIAFQVEPNPAIFVSAFPYQSHLDALSSTSQDWSIKVDGVKTSLKMEQASLELSSKGATVLFKAPHSGYYALDRTNIRRISGSDEIKIHIETFQGDRLIREFVLPADDVTTQFNVAIGYVAKGDEIHIKLTSKNNVVEVSFQAQIVEWAPRQTPLRVERLKDGYLGIRDPGNPETLRTIAPNRWITVLPGNGDSTEALRKAFSRAQALSNDGNYAGVRLQTGEVYTLGTDQTGGSLFEFRDAQKLIFDGNHAIFRVNTTDLQRKETKLFQFYNCKLMAFADISVEAINGQTYTYGEVINVETLPNGDQEITFQVPTNQPDPLKDIRTNGRASGFAYDAQHPGRLADGSWSHYPGARNLKLQLRATEKPGVFVHTVTRTNNSIEVDDLWVVKNKRGGILYLVANNSSNITLSGLDAKAHGGGAVRNWGATINLLNCRFELQESNIMSASSDAVHGRGREGVWIEDTVFNGVCEDILNTYASSILVLEDESDSDNVITLRMGSRKRGGAFSPGNAPSSNDLLVGDQLVFFNPQAGTIIGKATVRAITKDRITLSNPIKGIDYWDEGENNRSTVVYNQSSVAKVYIRDSDFMNSMRFGTFLKADQVVIFNTLFEGLAASAIYAANEPGWPEGPPAEHLWIQDCNFKDNGYGYSSKYRAHIAVDPADISIFTSRLRRSEEPDAYSAYLSNEGYANSHIKIIGNTFRNWRGMAIAVRNARNVLIDGNSFFAPIDDSEMRATLENTPLFYRNGKGIYAAIYMNLVNGAMVTNNRFFGLTGSDQSIILDQDALHIIIEGNTSSE